MQNVKPTSSTNLVPLVPMCEPGCLQKVKQAAWKAFSYLEGASYVIAGGIALAEVLGAKVAVFTAIAGVGAASGGLGYIILAVLLIVVGLSRVAAEYKDSGKVGGMSTLVGGLSLVGLSGLAMPLVAIGVGLAAFGALRLGYHFFYKTSCCTQPVEEEAGTSFGKTLVDILNQMKVEESVAQTFNRFKQAVIKAQTDHEVATALENAGEGTELSQFLGQDVAFTTACERFKQLQTQHTEFASVTAISPHSPMVVSAPPVMPVAPTPVAPPQSPVAMTPVVAPTAPKPTSILDDRAVRQQLPNIQETIRASGNDGKATLLANKSALEKRETEIDAVLHPVQVLAVIFADKDIRANMLKAAENSTVMNGVTVPFLGKFPGFYDKYTQKLRDKQADIQKHIEQFLSTMQTTFQLSEAEKTALRALVEKLEGKKLIDQLVVYSKTRIPAVS